MRFSVIDLGTNSIRFDICEIKNKSKVKSLYREKHMVRLGERVFLDGKICPHAKQRSIKCIKQFKEVALAFKSKKIIAFGTCALREARNNQTFVKHVLDKTGIKLQIISGQKEAKLIAQGVLRNEPNLKGHYILVDIGGGSTEISICHKKRRLQSWSLPLGAARLQQVFLKRIPPKQRKKDTLHPVLQLRKFIRKTIRQHISDIPVIPLLIGSSGTARCFSRMLQNSQFRKTGFPRSKLANLVREMKNMDRSQLKNLPGMEPKRSDLILAGGILLEEIANAFRIKRIVATPFALRDGIIADQVKRYRRRLKKGT